MRVTPANAEPGERRQVSNISDAISVAGEGLTISQVFAPEYRRSASSVSSITLAVPSCSVASSPSDEERSVSLGFSTSAAVNCASVCDGCCRVFDGRPWVSFETHGGERHGLRHRSCAACLKRNRRNLAALRAHCSQFWYFLVGRPNPPVHDVAIRDGEVCVSASGWKHSRRELFARCRKRAGRSGSLCRVSVTDVDTQHETPRHDSACRATTPRSMIDRAHVKRHTSTQHSTALHDMLWLHLSSHETHY